MLKSRRDFLAYASAFGLSTAAQGFATALAQGGTVRVRENITLFAKDPSKVAALRAAVGQMKARSAANKHDPLGWYYWTAVHGTDEATPPALKDIYGQCDHTFPPFGTPSYLAEHFLSWHRAFLFFFEVTLKLAAKEAKVQTELELPYWNWYADSALPAIFLEGNANSNPLWHPRSNTSINSAALQRAFFSQKDLLPGKPSDWAKSLSVPLERNPHGSIHGAIGGDMQSILRSARDPIFWVHHANIDRLWAVWINMGDGHKNPPTESTWAKREWAFDTQSKMKQVAGNLTDSETILKYRYDDISPVPPTVGPALVAQAPAVVIDGAPMQASGGTVKLGTSTITTSTIVSGTGAVGLGDKSVAVDLRLAPQSQGQLNALAVSAPAATGGITGAWLVLENVTITPQGQQRGFSFNVRATLPDGAGSRDVQLAELNTFNWPSPPAAAGHGHHPGTLSPVTMTIPLTDILRDLKVQKATDLAKGLRIVFEAVHPQTPATANVEFVKIDNVQVRTSTAPIQ